MASYISTTDTKSTTVYGSKPTVTVTVKAPFYPPTFTVFGKNIKDLIKKKYEFAHSIKHVDNTNDVTFESGFDANRVGYLLAKKKFPSYSVEAKASTAPSGESKVTVNVPRIAEGLTGSATIFGRPKDNTKQDLVNAKLEYVRPNFTATSEVNTNGNSHRAITTASIGFDNISLGGQVSVVADNSVEVNDYNLGVEYTYARSVASLWTEQQADFAVFNYYHLVQPNNAIGAQFKVEVGGTHSTNLTLANEYNFDNITSIKSKLDFPTGVLTTAFERRFVNPKVKFNIAASFTPANFMSKPVAADKFGIGLTFGAY